MWTTEGWSIQVLVATQQERSRGSFLRLHVGQVTPAVDTIRKTSSDCIGGTAQRFKVQRVGYVGEERGIWRQETLLVKKGSIGTRQKRNWPIAQDVRSLSEIGCSTTNQSHFLQDFQENYKALTVIEGSIKGKFSTVFLRGPLAHRSKPVLRWATHWRSQTLISWMMKSKRSMWNNCCGLKIHFFAATRKWCFQSGGQFALLDIYNWRANWCSSFGAHLGSENWKITGRRAMTWRALRPQRELASESNISKLNKLNTDTKILVSNRKD